MKYKNITKQILLIVFFASLIILSSYQVYSITYLSQGSFQLLLYENGSIQIQLNDKYVAVKLNTPNTINTTSGYMFLTQEQGLLKFTSNVDGTIQLFTNMSNIELKINNNARRIENNDTFNFDTNDIISIKFGIPDIYINFYIGLIGIGLFCANPVLSYKLSDNAKDKFKFFFILTAIGIVSLGLAMTFIYSGI